MNDFFIQKLVIKDVREIKNFAIPLDDGERKHLIITGKNGCGKTSTLVEIDNLLNKLINNQFAQMTQIKKNIEQYENVIEQTHKNIESYQKQIEIQIEQKNNLFQNQEVNGQQIEQVENNIKSYSSNILNEKTNIQNYENQIVQWQKDVDDFSKVELIFSNQSAIYEDIVNGKFILAFFEAKRHNEPTMPQTPTKQIFQPKYQTKDKLNKTFLQYLLNLKTEQAFAQIRHDTGTVIGINIWFDNFEARLKELFEQEELKLFFDDKEFNFKIEYDSKSFGLNELSDGYSSLLAILTELILRMEAQQAQAYDMQGVVLIDEIETHLHVELQKKVLPFLVSFFPKIQFIVTTHSPFVLSSLSNAVICDLERREIVSSERFINASYSQIVKNYFQVDSEFSRVLVNEIKQYENMVLLFENGRLDEKSQKELLDLDLKLDKLSSMLSDEIYLRFKEAQGKIQNND
ncbi:MAG: AAA family ATPase [Sulfurimonas sp.]|jgi:predicted ATP-binding protein involved in virulence